MNTFTQRLLGVYIALEPGTGGRVVEQRGARQVLASEGNLGKPPVGLRDQRYKAEFDAELVPSIGHNAALSQLHSLSRLHKLTFALCAALLMNSAGSAASFAVRKVLFQVVELRIKLDLLSDRRGSRVQFGQPRPYLDDLPLDPLALIRLHWKAI
jgi:hypothetical protein